jgi:hypothetical protein
VRRKAKSAVQSRSPLIQSVFPPYSKVAYDKEKGLDRGFEALRLNIPPDVLFSIPQQDKSDKQDIKSTTSGSSLSKKENNTLEIELPVPQHHPTSKASKMYISGLLPSIYADRQN